MEGNERGQEKAVASDSRILKIGEERKVAGEESGGEKSTKKQSARVGGEEGIGPSKLNETIDGSVKGATQTVAKYYSMERDRPEEDDEGRKDTSDSSATNTRYSSRRRDSSHSYPYVEPREKSRKRGHANPTGNADNRRMTGNVNIYICSEANGQGVQKWKGPARLDASSDLGTDRSCSRCSSSRTEPRNGRHGERRKEAPRAQQPAVRGGRERLENGATIGETRVEAPNDQEGPKDDAISSIRCRCECSSRNSSLDLDATDDSGPLLRSIYTDCTACLADDSRYPGNESRDSVPNRARYKPTRASAERRRSACSCIAEEEEEDDDGRAEKKRLSANLRPTRMTRSDAEDRLLVARTRQNMQRLSTRPGANSAREATSSPDSAASKEIAHAILDSNFRNKRGNARGTQLANVAKDKVGGEKAMSANLGSPDKAAAARQNERNNVTAPRFYFTGQQPVEDGMGNISNERPNVSVEPTGNLQAFVRDSPKLSQETRLDDGPNHSSSRASKGFVDPGSDARRGSRGRTRSIALSKDVPERNPTPIEGQRFEGKVAENLKEEADAEAGSRKDQKDTLLHRSLRKLLDIIRRHEAMKRSKDRDATEGERKDSITGTTQHDGRDDQKAISDRVHDDDDDDEEGERADTARKRSSANKHETPERAKSTVTDDAATFSKEDKKADISGGKQAAPLTPKLFPVIPEKRQSRSPATEASATKDPKVQELETRAVGVEIAAEQIAAVEVENAAVPKATSAYSMDDGRACRAGSVMDARYAYCPRKKIDEESRRPISTPCECGIHFESNGGPHVVHKLPRYHDALEDEEEPEGAKEGESCVRELPTYHPKNRFRRDELVGFCSASLSSDDRRGAEEECKYRKATSRLHPRRSGDPEHGYQHIVCRNEREQLPARVLADVTRRRGRRVDRRRREDEHWRGVERECERKRPMICLYCDNPRDKCTCRAPIGRCLSCGLPSDVCDRREDRGRDDACERAVGRASEGEAIRVTGWKPRREIGRYFARDDPAASDCRCCEQPKRPGPGEQLPYQRLNAFSDVMNELQWRMSGSVHCTRCRRNLCCSGGGGGGLQVNSDKGKKRGRVKGYVSGRNDSPAH